MKFAFSKAITVALFLLIFIGQGTAASVMPYQMTGMSMNSHDMSQKMIETEMTNHHEMGNHDMSSMSQSTDKEAMADCCPTNCDCATSACSLAATMPSALQIERFFSSFGKISLTSPLHISFTPSSLYRPPIFS